MKTLAVIPARLGATRLPRKPLRLLAGVPIVVRVLERVRALRVAHHVVVATDSEEIIDAVQEAGGEAIPTSIDHPSGTDRIAEVVRAAFDHDFDAIVNVQGDEPFVSGAAVRGALAQVTERGFPLGTAAVRASRDVLAQSDVVKVVAADDGAAMYFSRAGIPFLRDRADAAELEELVLHHVGVYAYTPDALAHWVFLPTHPLDAGMRMGVAVIDGPLRGGIDTEADLERANREWMTFTASES